MKQYISKSALVAEIERRILEDYNTGDVEMDEVAQGVLASFKYFLDTLEVKEGLTWQDIRELYIIFAEVDVDIELCKTDIKTETLGYYQEVLKRFKAKRK